MIRRVPRPLALALTLSLSLSLSAAALPISGLVFRDANGNGRHDAGEPGWADVAVTDGLTFATTGADGRYRMDALVDPLRGAKAAPLITVCWPSGCWPSGPRWQTVAPTKADAVDFGLKPAEQKLPFRFVHATDTHVPRAGRQKMTDFKAEVASIAAEQSFCVLTGDLVDLSDSHTYEQGRDEWGFFAEQTANFPVPWLAIPGNHDIAGVRAKSGWDKEHPDYGYGFYDRIVGPLRWSFDYAGVHFAAVDFNATPAGAWAWGVPQSAIDWLKLDLARVKPGTRKYLFVHYPVVPNQGFAELVSAAKVDYIFTGHAHTDRIVDVRGVKALIGGSVSQVFEDKDRETGYRLVQINADGFEHFYKTTGKPHAVTIDSPRYNTTLKPGDIIRGAFYDPARAITKLEVSFGEVKAEVPFQRGSLACSFETKLDLGAVADGTWPLVVTMTKDGETIAHTFNYAFAKPKAAAPAK